MQTFVPPMPSTQNPDSPKSNEALKRSFDTSAIPFPTGGIQLQTLVDRFPSDFQWKWGSFITPESCPSIDVLFNAMHSERELAAMAFCKAAGIAFEGAEGVSVGREELCGILSSAYEQLGIASGQHQADELIRSIERQASQQAVAGTRARNS
jgi:hypothetical protein